MKKISEEVKLEYKNELGREGVEKFYKLMDKHKKYNAFSNALTILAIILSIFTIAYILKNENVPPVAFVTAMIFGVILSIDGKIAYERFEYSIGCIYLTEFIEADNFDFVTATIGIDEDAIRYFILRSYDKNENVINEFQFIINTDYMFSETEVASLHITNECWELEFPKSKMLIIE